MLINVLKKIPILRLYANKKENKLKKELKEKLKEQENERLNNIVNLEKIKPLNFKSKYNLKFFEMFFYFENSIFLKNFSIFIFSFINNINPYKKKEIIINNEIFNLNNKIKNKNYF